MKMDERFEELLAFFKALADANRLKIIGLLSDKAYSVEEMAEVLDLNSSTVSHHLAKLSEIGLVSARAEGYYSLYQLETQTLEEMSQRLLAKETFPAVVQDLDLDAYDRKVLHDYMGADGRFAQLPTQYKKLQAVLRHIIKSFEVGRIYREKEVNAILAQFNGDISGVRRDLISEKLLAREKDGSAYWRV
jgi:predicted transcriptional regulator